MSDPVVGVVAFVVTLIATPLAIVVARHTGIVDHPGALKPQTRAVPYLGGVAVLAGVAVGAGAGRPSVLVALGAATALGVADDRFDVPPVLRLVAQLGIGALVVLTCPLHLPGVPGAVALVAVSVLLINGVNLIDGLDLLATGVVAVAAGAFAVVLLGSGRSLAVAGAAALVAFGIYNRPPARVYLGDGGSYLLGTLLAVLVARAFAPGVAPARGVATLALVAVPAGEVAFALVRRLRSHRSLLAGDRGHPYDRLVARGWSALAASGAYWGTEAVLAAGVLIVVLTKAPLAAAVVLDVAAAVVVVVAAALAGALSAGQDARA